MELFKVSDVSINIPFEITYSCLTREEVYLSSRDGKVHKYILKRNDKQNENTVELVFQETYPLKNKTVNKIIILEKINVIVLLIENSLYFVKNKKFQILTLINKNVSDVFLNESTKLDLLLCTKKKFLLYKYEVVHHKGRNKTNEKEKETETDIDDGNFILFSEVPFQEPVLSLVWLENLLFLAIQKKYYLLNLKDNEKVLLYNHEFNQNYKHITLVSPEEIFIVCDSNIGVFYDTKTWMPSLKNPIILSEHITHINVYQFFLYSLHSTGHINFYNVKNQQLVQTIQLTDPVHEIINYTNSYQSFSAKGYGSQKREHKEAGQQMSTTMYLINNKVLKIICCVTLYEYLKKCVNDNKVAKGFSLIENYNFNDELEKSNVLKEYNKICGYFFFQNLQFSYAFLHFEKSDVNVLFLLSFWSHYLPTKWRSCFEIKKDSPIEESVSSIFQFVLPPPTTIEELINKNYNSYTKRNKGFFIQEKETYSSTTGNEEQKMKTHLLYVANSCLIKYLLKQREHFFRNKDHILFTSARTTETIEKMETTENEMETLHTHMVIDAILLKLMILNKCKNYKSFIYKTDSLNERHHLEEYIQFLEKKQEFISIIYVYLRVKQYQKVIELCSYFFYLYDSFAKGEQEAGMHIGKSIMETESKSDNEKENHRKERPIQEWKWEEEQQKEKEKEYLKEYVIERDSESEREKWGKENVKSCSYEWLKTIMKSIYLKTNKKNKMLKELYDILIVLNEKVHLINCDQRKIKKLFENAFPILMKYNKTRFFRFLTSQNFVLNASEILLIFKNIEKQKILPSGQIKKYMKKYIVQYLKRDQSNRDINTAFIEYYIQSKEINILIRQKKVLKFLKKQLPLHVSYLIDLIHGEEWNLAKVALLGKIHLHYDSLEILVKKSLRMCELYCYHYNKVLLPLFEKMDDTTFEGVYMDIFNGDRNAYKKLITNNVSFTNGCYTFKVEESRKERKEKKGRKKEREQEKEQAKKEEKEQENCNEDEEGKEKNEDINYDRLKKKEKKEDAYLNSLLRRESDYHQFCHVQMNRNMLTKMKKGMNANHKREQRNRKKTWGKGDTISSVTKNEELMNDSSKFEWKNDSTDFMMKLLNDEESESSEDIDNDEIINTNIKDTEYSSTEDSTESVSSDDITEENTSEDINDNSSIDNLGKSNKRNEAEKEKGEKGNKKRSKTQDPKYYKKKTQTKMDILHNFGVYKNVKRKSPGLFFLLIKVLMDYYSKSQLTQKKESYKQKILYILNKHCIHEDFDSFYLFPLIPEVWKINEIADFVLFQLKKKTHTLMNMQVYHNLVKSQFLNISYEMIKQKEQKVILKDDTLCRVCNKPILGNAFVFYSNEIFLHLSCLSKYEKKGPYVGL